MKIAVWHNLPSGGGKRALHDHLHGLVGRGHHVEVWSPPTADREFLSLAEIAPEHVVPLQWDERGGPLNEVRALGALTKVRRNLRALEEHCRRCGEEISAGNFDLLFANSCVFVRTAPIARYVNIPTLLYLQEPNRRLFEALPHYPWAAPFSKNGALSLAELRRILRDLARIQSLRLQARDEIANAARFDTILVNSLFSRESVLRAYGLESRVCYLGVDSDKFKPTGEKRADFVIGLGGIDYLKGVDRAIRGLGALPASKRPELVWVSNFENVGTQSELEALARSCEVEFKLLVGVTEAELSSLLSRARMLLYTSRLEPFGYAPLEVNACGTPVVAIAEGGIRETVRDEVNGLLVRSAEPAALAAAVERLIDDPQLAQRLGNVGMHEVRERWTIEAGIDNIEHELLQLVERKRARCSL